MPDFYAIGICQMSDSRRDLQFPYSPFIITLQNGYERIFSVLISTKVHENLQSIPGDFEFIVQDESITPTIFKRFLEFAHCHICDDFSRDEQQFFLRISVLLGNEPFMYLLLEGQREKVKKNSKIESSSQEINFEEIGADHCASHFFCYSVDLLRRLNKDILHRILSSPSLELESEDDFVRILIELLNHHKINVLLAGFNRHFNNSTVLDQTHQNCPIKILKRGLKCDAQFGLVIVQNVFE
jgi:hypothetical protein